MGENLMLVITIKFNAQEKDEYTTNGIRVVPYLEKATYQDLQTALAVCTSFRRNASIPVHMSIEIENEQVKVSPLNDNEQPLANKDNIEYVSPDRLPFVHQFFKDLRTDINMGIQDYLNLEEDKPKVKNTKKSKKKTNINKDTGVIRKKRW